MSDLIIRIGGEGGEGVISAGDMVAQAAVRSGLNILTYKTFPAEIRGGYAMYQIRFSDKEIMSEGTDFDVFCAFNKEALDNNRAYLKPGTVLIYDFPGGDIKEEVNIEGVTCYNLPMSQIAKKELEMYRAKNMVALGALSELFDINKESVQGTIHSKFGKKGEAVVNTNLKAIEAGANYIRENHKKTDSLTMGKSDQDTSNKIIIAGNYAAGMGALIAGCKFFSAYPITPATEVAIMVAGAIPKLGGNLVQAEDEIASIANVIGASFAGLKSMTSTSGPGLSLMQELLGLASMAEIPLVVVDVQRGGPSTGMPTKHEQSDLFLAAHGGHGDAPRIVISPENVSDIIDQMVTAFNLSEKYQMPVLLLSDGSLGLRTESIDRPDPSKYTIIDRQTVTSVPEGEEFHRYEVTESGISPMSKPGIVGGTFIATGLEHTTTSSPACDGDTRNAQCDKRFRKIANLENEVDAPEVIGDEDAELGLISWGSTLGTMREAISLARAEGIKVKGLFPKIVWPVPKNAIEAFAKGTKKILIPEINAQGQLAKIIKSETSVDAESYIIYGGNPFTPHDILNKIKEVL